MPIDLAAIAARFTELAFQDRLATTAGRVIQSALDRRALAARAAEVSTGDLPVLRFEDGALAVRVLASGRQGAAAVILGAGELAATTVGIGVAGGDRWLHAANDLPAFIDAANELAGAIDASITRYATPTPQLFDPSSATVFDTFGAAAAMYAALQRALRPGGDAERILAAVTAATRVLGVTDVQPSNAAVSAAAAMGLAALPIAGAPVRPESDDGADSTALATTVLLLALPRLVSVIVAAVDIRAHLFVLDMLAAVEHGARTGIAGICDVVFTTLGSLGWGLRQTVRGIDVAVGAYIRGEIAFALAFGAGFGTAVKKFVLQLAAFLLTVTRFMQILVGVLEYIGLDRWIKLPGFDPLDRSIKVYGIDLPTTPLPTEPPPLNFHSTLPDFENTLFGSDVRHQVADILTATDEGMRSILATRLAATATGLDARAAQFSGLADIAGTTGPLALGIDADHRVAAALFPNEPSPSHRDPLAQAFSSWIAYGGIGVVEGVVTRYAHHMARLWRARYLEEPAAGGPTADTPAATSPHILRRHTIPGRVQVPRVVIRISGDPDDLLPTVAAEFAGAVRSAYRHGTQLLPAGAER
jgi:hypothetical protein